MRGLVRLSLGIDHVSRALGKGVAWLTLLMVLVGAFNAVGRTIEREMGIQLTSNAYIELQWYLFSLVFLLGAPITLRAGAHVRVDVLYGGHSWRGKAWIDLLGGLLLLIPFCLFAIWISQDFVLDSWDRLEQSSDPGGLPRWPLKAIVPIAFTLIALQGVSEVIKRLGLLRGMSPDELGLDEPSLRDTSGRL